MTEHATATLARIRCVLVETTHTGNLGAAARALKAMGLTRLELVKPRHPPDAEALARAAGADDLLQRAGVHGCLVDALTGCRLVIGASARLRSVEWPLLEPPQAAQRLLAEAAQGQVALVFGRESSGLTNEELARCHYLVHIPTDPGFSSLNVAAAVQVLAYEVRRAWREGRGETLTGETRDLATAEAMDGFHQHLAQTLVDIGFRDPDQSTRLLMRLRRLFNRARLDWVELNILRGILRAAQGRNGANRHGPEPHV
ncbi:MAG TPA: RNA methyltransferase [Lamprocystis sp. (in: g-proteobacteria)]|nr:RNA methyltransferase [Lamprocystis sp. (in: g-proteobacteria)]